MSEQENIQMPTTDEEVEEILNSQPSILEEYHGARAEGKAVQDAFLAAGESLNGLPDWMIDEKLRPYFRPKQAEPSVDEQVSPTKTENSDEAQVPDGEVLASEAVQIPERKLTTLDWVIIAVIAIGVALISYPILRNILAVLLVETIAMAITCLVLFIAKPDGSRRINSGSGRRIR